jgi:hypothetical protein
MGWNSKLRLKVNASATLFSFAKPTRAFTPPTHSICDLPGAVTADSPFRFVAGDTLTKRTTFPVEMPRSVGQIVEHKVSDASGQADLWVLGLDDDL